jgi:hypothetical protein
VPISATFTVPGNIPDTVVAEAIAQHANLMASTLIESACKTGFAPT